MLAEKVISALDAVARRTPARINSLKCFAKEIVALPDPRNRAWQKKQLEKIVRRICNNSVGRTDYSTGDFVEDVKRAFARESVPFDNDISNELAGWARLPEISGGCENCSIAAWNVFVEIANACLCSCRAGGGSFAGTGCRASVPRA